jgi:ABC-type dipeptide/oligopeptide/nickel transport system permease subunit
MIDLGPRTMLGRLRRHPSATVGLVLIAILVAFATLGPMLSPHDPWTSDFAHGIDALGRPVGPSHRFLLGTDRIFRDELTRLAYGGRLSLLIALSATLLSCAVGGLVGVVAGFYEGALIDVALMRIVDVGLAFPFLLLVMVIGAALDRTSALTILVVLGFTGWLGVARVVRAKTIRVRNLDFVAAAKALGQSTPRVLVLHILPNVAGSLAVLATLSVAQMIVAESVLSYLGAGIAPPVPTWGHMLFEGQDSVMTAPWMLLAPASAILVAVAGFNLVGEGLVDVLGSRDLLAKRQ